MVPGKDLQRMGLIMPFHLARVWLALTVLEALHMGRQPEHLAEATPQEELVLGFTARTVVGCHQLVGTRTILAGTPTILVGTRTILAGTRTILVGTPTILAGTRTILVGTPMTLVGILTTLVDKDKVRRYRI